MEYEEEAYNELWRTLPAGVEPPAAPTISEADDGFDDEVKLPEENILYFLEKNGPELKAWQREILRIVRNLAQYFYPQRQTKVMNEGCATFVHYTLMNRLHEKGLITEGSFLEFLHSHTSVVFQPGFVSHLDLAWEEDATVSSELADALKAEARNRITSGTFSGHIAYASILATRP